MNDMKNITARKAYEMLEPGDAVEIIDVRQPEEYREIHIEPSRLLPPGELGTFTMNDAQGLRRCRECETVFEPDVADRDPSGAPRCPQCFLSSSIAVLDLDEREMVIRQSTPFR